MIDRSEIIDALEAACEPLDYVNAMWLGGSVAFDRLDELSDIDVVLNIEQGHVDDAIEHCLQTLRAISPIKKWFRQPHDSAHGQIFCQLENTSPFHYVDLFFEVRDQPPQMREVELHGTPVVLFDKRDVTATTHVDWDDIAAQIAKRLPMLRGHVQIFSVHVDKEFRRGHTLAALHAYQRFVLAPLTDVLRMRYCPARFSWGIRYAHVDLPSDVAAKLEQLHYVGQPSELADRCARAVQWFETEADIVEASPPAKGG